MSKNKDNKRYAPVVFLISALTLVVTVSCAFLVLSHINPEIRTTIGSRFEKSPTEATEAPSSDSSARLMCAGNNMIYRSIYNNAASLASGSESPYDFSPIYENIKGIISKADIAMISQPSVLSDNIPVSSYPSFSSPTQVGDALYDMGFRVFNHASRYVFDKGEQGAIDTLEYWGTKTDALVTGLYKNEADRDTVRFKEVNGIKIAFISLTDVIQSQLTAESEINVISLGDKNRSKAEVYNIINDMIKTAKEEADAVVVSVFFDENTSEISSSQQQTVDFLVSFGADVIIGCGNNVIAPIERVERDDGTSAVVCHSLGNFISAEEKKENMLGGIADIVFEKSGKTGETIVKTAKVIPIITYYERNYTNFSVLNASTLTDEDIFSHSLYSSNGFNAAYANEMFEANFKSVEDGEFLPESDDTENAESEESADEESPFESEDEEENGSLSIVRIKC